MKKYTYPIISGFISSLCMLGFYGNSFGANLGDVTVVNNNKSALKIEDALQFELVTNGDGLVDTAVLPANPPDNMQVLTKWSFSDQTNQFAIYVRDVSKQQTNYKKCSSTISYNAKQPPITINGSSDGTNYDCQINKLY